MPTINLEINNDQKFMYSPYVTAKAANKFKKSRVFLLPIGNR